MMGGERGFGEVAPRQIRITLTICVRLYTCILVYNFFSKKQRWFCKGEGVVFLRHRHSQKCALVPIHSYTTQSEIVYLYTCIQFLREKKKHYDGWGRGRSVELLLGRYA